MVQWTAIGSRMVMILYESDDDDEIGRVILHAIMIYQSDDDDDIRRVGSHDRLCVGQMIGLMVLSSDLHTILTKN